MLPSVMCLLTSFLSIRINPVLYSKIRNGHSKRYIFYHTIENPISKCLLFQVNEFSNRIANHFQSNGFKAGDIVGLFMENRPEYVCIWLWLSKIGVVVPLINTNLRLNSLLHSITVANCNALIFGQSLIFHWEVTISIAYHEKKSFFGKRIEFSWCNSKSLFYMGQFSYIRVKYISSSWHDLSNAPPLDVVEVSLDRWSH